VTAFKVAQALSSQNRQKPQGTVGFSQSPGERCDLHLQRLHMRLKTLRIENFRGITDLAIEFGSTTVLLGENNAGKTTVLEALYTCMSRGLTRRGVPFAECDFHLATAKSEPADAPPIVLTLTFEESRKEEWPDAVAQAFTNAIQVLDDERQQLTFQVTAKYDKTIQDFSAEWSFLDKTGAALPTAKQAKLVMDLQQLSPVFLLGAVRDASQHFHIKSPFWWPFTKNPQIADEKKDEIEKQLAQINQSVLDGHAPFESVKDRIAQAGKLLPLSATDPVTVEAVPTRILDLLSRTQVKLTGRGGARLPLSSHGAGAQSLSVLFLFEAFLQSRLAEAYDQHSVPILALEEPEAHLHPFAIRALWGILDKLAGQKIIATQSGDFAGAVPLLSIRRLSRKAGRVQLFCVKAATLSEREAQKVAYHVRARRGSLLFARCWLLVEGESDFILINELARTLGHDLDASGISLVDFSHCGLVPLVKVAEDLGIEWHLLADGDKAGQDFGKAAEQMRGATSSGDRITSMPDLDIEHCMWSGGHSALYEAAVTSGNKGLVTTKPGDAQYPTETIKAAIASYRGKKPSLAYAVLTDAVKAGPAGVPAPIRTAIEVAVRLASIHG
jgi:putative ATP-dependent endonuclease of OLD family